MTLKLGLVALLLLASLPAFAEQKFVGSVRYEDAARMTFYEFENGVRTTGAIIPKNLAAGEGGLKYETLGRPAYDCSTEMYLCAREWYRVYAVPRTMLRKNTMYAAGGAQFRVEECLGLGNNECRIAIISSDCQQSVSDDQCALVSGGREKSSDPGPIVYFIYNEDFGITAFGVTSNRAGSSNARREIASQLILQGSRGLLKK